MAISASVSAAPISDPLRRPSLVILEEETEAEHSDNVAVFPRSCSPANNFSARADTRKRYSYYDHASAAALSASAPSSGGSGGSTPLLDSLLDPNVGADPPRRLNRSKADPSKRASWYAGSSVTRNFSLDHLAPFQAELQPPPRSTSPYQHSANSSISSNGSFTVPAPIEAAATAVASSELRAPSNSPPRAPSPTPYQPFNFQSVTLDTAPSASRPAQRRGHRYKHSSVSMNFFKEDVRAPLTIPASLPIPTISECRQSMSSEQTGRMAWGIFHLFVAFLVYTTDSPFSAISALAHLLFYDAMGALLCGLVDTLENFNVWKTSSIHFPFGLERAEVLAAFAMSISLIFTSGDIMSHSIQDIVQVLYSGEFSSASHDHGMGGHSHGHAHDGEINWTSVFFRVFLGIVATIVSAIGLDNHARISRAMSSAGTSTRLAFNSLPWILSNPSHFITLTFSALILAYPLVPENTRRVVDSLLTPCIAASMCYVGWILAKSLSGMLVMSFPGENRVDQVKDEVSKLPGVVTVNDVSVWQVHHSVWLACMKIGMEGTEADEQFVRERAGALVQDIMSETSAVGMQVKSYAKAKLNQTLEKTRWETTIDIDRTPQQCI